MQTTCGRVPESNREHADESGDGVQPPLRERSQDNLGITSAGEVVSKRLELGANKLEVVDLAVEYHVPVAASGSHWLMAEGTKIQNRQAPMPEADAMLVTEPLALIVRPAVMQ